MLGHTIFVAGIYGVGKSTLCKKVSKVIGILEYSASDLISKVNGEQYGANKFVANKDKNQNVLASAVEDLLSSNGSILLAGHFCLVNKNDGVEVISRSVFEKLFISQIILLEADLEIVSRNIKHRDDRDYSEELIKELMVNERKQAEEVAKFLDKPLFIHHMGFNDTDIEKTVSIIHSEKR